VVEELRTRIAELEAEVERLQANPQPNVHPIRREEPSHGHHAE
jgi:hypothetical protein